ncbi:MAG TPA: glycosyltransferase family 4 protein [Nocardioides sp.]|nr:glycosyltransferase family 4 protein [Nocardioides sp.]
MRIGLVAPPWIPVPPPAYGGTEAVVANLARGLSERGHDVTLFTLGDSTCPVRRRHVFEHPVEPFGQTVPEAAHVLAAYDALRGVDIIHDHTILGALVAARSRLDTPPVVVTNHGLFTALTRPVFREIGRTAYVVAISADQAGRAGGVPISAVIHHGIDLDTYRCGPGGGEHLVFVGRMSADKGVAEALRIAHAAGRPLRVVSKMRDAEERAYFESCVRPLLDTDDEHLDELGVEERAALVGRAYGLLNPISWPEPFGLVMAESLASGTPVVARRAGAAPEIVTHGHTGFLFRREPEAVAAVARLSEIDRQVCRAEAERRFSLARMAADHERLYERILDGRDRATVTPLSRAAGARAGR